MTTLIRLIAGLEEETFDGHGRPCPQCRSTIGQNGSSQPDMSRTSPTTASRRAASSWLRHPHWLGVSAAVV